MKQQQMTAAKYKLGEIVELFTINILSLQPEHDGVLLTSVATYALQWGQLVETGWVVKADTCTLQLRKSQTWWSTKFIC